MLQDALVEALEPGREQGQVLLARELVDDPLVELPALRRQRDHPVLGQAAVDALERRGDDVHPQDHPRAAAVRLVVDLAPRRPVAVVEEAQVELAAEDGGDGALLGDGSEDMGYEREDVEAQGFERLVVDCEALRYEDSPRIEVDLSDARFDEREQDSCVELEGVVGRAGDDVGDNAEPAPPPPPPQADELEHVELARPGRGEVGPGNLEPRPTWNRPVEADHQAAAACLRSSTRTSSPPRAGGRRARSASGPRSPARRRTSRPGRAACRHGRPERIPRR